MYFVAALMLFSQACRKDCNLQEPNSKYFRIDEEGKGRKQTCYYVRVGADIEVKSIGDVKALKEKIGQVRGQENGTIGAITFKGADIKDIYIEVKEPIVVTPEDYPTMRGLKDLQGYFTGITLHFSQNGQVVCPRDPNTPLSCNEVKQWIWNSTQKIEIGVNPWSGNKFLADDPDCFKENGYNPDLINRIIRDTVTRTIPSIQWFQNNKDGINLEIDDTKSGSNNKFYIIEIGNDLSVTDANKNSVADIANFRKNKVKYPDSLVMFSSGGYAIIPENPSISVSHTVWNNDWDGLKLGENKGVKFVASCKDTAAFRADGLDPKIFDVDNRPCTDNDTIKILTLADLNGAPVKLAASVAKPLTNTYLMFPSNGNVALVNDGKWEANMNAVMDYVYSGTVTLVKGGKVVYFSNDSTNVNDVSTVKRMDDKEILKAGSGYPWKSNCSSNDVSDIRSTSITWLTDKVKTSDGTNFSNPIPREVEVNTSGATSVAGFKVLKNMGWTRDITLNVTANGAYLNGVDDDILDMLDEPAGPALNTVSFRIVSATNVQLADYRPNTISMPDGLNNTKYEFDGGNYSGNKLYSSWLKNGSNGNPVRASTTTNVQSTFWTANPNYIVDTGAHAGHFYFDWDLLSAFVQSNGGRFLFNNAVTYTTNNTVLSAWVNIVIVQNKSPSAFYSPYNIITTGNNVEMIDPALFPVGKQTFQPADQGSLSMVAKQKSVAQKSVVAVKKYSNSKQGVKKFLNDRGIKVRN